jgi:UDP-N-acetylmuramyl pentapeptide phosphotransferase/UDP-N-acetylglucosamine-1-phosphate transferase
MLPPSLIVGMMLLLACCFLIVYRLVALVFTAANKSLNKSDKCRYYKRSLMFLLFVGACLAFVYWIFQPGRVIF